MLDLFAAILDVGECDSDWGAGYPFSSYGEVVACWFQDVVIVGLIFRFK